MKKTPKRKHGSLTIEVICKTKVEHLIMLIIVVYCQYFYRKLKKEDRRVTIFNIVAAARNAYNEKQLNMPELDRSEVIWG